jgi:uncharacterized membrane protein
MTFIWGVNYVAAKISLRSFPPLVFAPLRSIFAAMFLLPIYAWMRKRKPQEDPWTRRELYTLAALGVCGITLNQVFFILGMNITSVAHAALIIATGPVFVLLLAALRGQERITARKAAGMALAISGVAALKCCPDAPTEPASSATRSSSSPRSPSPCSPSLARRPHAPRRPHRQHRRLRFRRPRRPAAAAVAGLVFQFRCCRRRRLGDDDLHGAVSQRAVLHDLLPALTRIDASRVAAFSYAQPVIASLTGLAVLAEPLTLPIAMGGLLVLSGVWLTGRK